MGNNEANGFDKIETSFDVNIVCPHAHRAWITDQILNQGDAMSAEVKRQPVKSICRASIFLLVNAMFVHSSNAADFPGTGHKFIADFKKFRFEQSYTSPNSLTYTALNSDGSRGTSDTVNVRTQEVANSVYMVS
jgi:hypothetical protein